MKVDRGLFDKIRDRGQEVLTELSAELMQNPRFVKAVEGAVKGRERLEQAAGRALKQMNLPTPAELRRANARIAALEREVAELRHRTGRRSTKPAAAAASARKPVKAGRRPAAGKPRRPAPRQPRRAGD